MINGKMVKFYENQRERCILCSPTMRLPTKLVKAGSLTPILFAKAAFDSDRIEGGHESNKGIINPTEENCFQNEQTGN